MGLILKQDYIYIILFMIFLGYVVGCYIFVIIEYIINRYKNKNNFDGFYKL